MCRELWTTRRREYPGGDSNSDGYRRPKQDQRPPDREVYPGGRPPDRGGHPDRGGYPNGGGRPPGRGGYPGGGPPDGGGSPGLPGGQGPPGTQGPPRPMRPIIVQTPQVTLDTTTLENTFDTVGQSMMQLARAQDQTNRQL